MDNKCLSGTGTTSEGVGVLVFDVSPADFETRPEKKIISIRSLLAFKKYSHLSLNLCLLSPARGNSPAKRDDACTRIALTPVEH